MVQRLYISPPCYNVHITTMIHYLSLIVFKCSGAAAVHLLYYIKFLFLEIVYFSIGILWFLEIVTRI